MNDQPKGNIKNGIIKNGKAFKAANRRRKRRKECRKG